MKVLYNTDHTNDSEFLKGFRMYRPELFPLAELLEDNSVYKTADWKPFRGKPQAFVCTDLSYFPLRSS
ncbi:hypothetical protein PHMEG_00014084 [Phytophthora megakarya]|uniref:Uncharacterized protein n=1 Tax=Phytophthora megakarya TaxID=4795 RepID=A0A225W798_9STRA|nr:hypothetical protein PHMEG_00014084 [Phytophthora megakarya]